MPGKLFPERLHRAICEIGYTRLTIFRNAAAVLSIVLRFEQHIASRLTSFDYPSRVVPFPA